jgi:hypothetical protein
VNPTPRSSRVIRTLVALHPPSFRRRYGDGVLAFCTERVHTARSRGESPVRAWTRVVADLSASAIVEWMRVPHLPSGVHMKSLLQEFALALRSLRKSPAFTGASVATLALGIGAATAIFSVVDTVMLRPMPFAEPERVVVPHIVRADGTRGNYIPYGDFMDWRDNKIFDKVAVFQTLDMDLASDGEPVRVSSATVGPEFFASLGAVPQKGRMFDARDYPVTAGRAVVISDRLWRTRFGGRDDIVGLEVDVNSIRRPIVGVLPAQMEWPIDVDLWVPLRLSTEQDPGLQRRDNQIFQSIARMAPGRTLPRRHDHPAREILGGFPFRHELLCIIKQVANHHTFIELNIDNLVQPYVTLRRELEIRSFTGLQRLPGLEQQCLDQGAPGLPWRIEAQESEIGHVRSRRHDPVSCMDVEGSLCFQVEPRPKIPNMHKPPSPITKTHTEITS